MMRSRRIVFVFLIVFLLYIIRRRNERAIFISPEEIESLRDSKIVVMGRLEGDDTTSWVAENLPDWQTAIYTVDNTSAPLHTPANKGREAMPYLTYIIDHYTNLPTTIVFLHSHRRGFPQAWHVDNDDHDNVKSLQNLRINYVQENRYVNLRCQWRPGCPAEIQPFRTEPAIQDEEDRRHEELLPEAWEYIFGNTDVPAQIGATCCGQFAVSRDAVLERPWEQYVRMRQWLLDTEAEDGVSGRVFEYLWHIIFGMNAVYCPRPSVCFCKVYGKCKELRSWQKDRQ